MSDTSQPRVLPWAAALLTMLLWASSFVVIREAGPYFSPGGMTLLRSATAGVVLSLWMLWRRPRWPRSRRSWVALALWGAAWFGVYSLVLNASELMMDAGTAAMIVNLAPLIVAVVAGRFFGEGLPVRLVGGILVALAGIGLITTATFSGRITLAGLVLALMAALIYAGCILTQKQLLHADDSVTVTWLGILTATVAFLPFTPVLIGEISRAPLPSTLLIAYMGVFPTAIAFNTWGYALRSLPAGLLSSSSLIVPAVVVAFSWLLLGEVPSPLAAVGGLLCLGGAAFAVLPQVLSTMKARPGQSQ